MPVSASDLVPGKTEHETAAIVALIRSKKVKGDRVAALVEGVGSAVKLIQLDEEAGLFSGLPLGAHEAIGAVGARELEHALHDVDRWRRRELDVRTVLDPTYPQNLLAIYNRPALLFVEGTWDEARDSRSVAVVGAREATPDSLELTDRMTWELARAGFTIISGLAKGIDAAAHSAALAERGRTVGVMGTGIDHRYPKEHAGLADRIVASGGALVAQFFPHQGPTRWTFGLRNVVMSGLALATVVVEAGPTSGARMQARQALEHGRAVFLLRPLVEKHKWAQRYVTEGKYDTRAVEVATAGEIVERLDSVLPEQAPIAV